ncbi:MAG: polyphosphate kinase 1 [Amoebophilaceae bacterium]|nr:polyphosphate kinase 1 [Amoebophilaceae bacterium]
MVIDSDNVQRAPATSKKPEHYLNRDLSWLRFHERVLDQAGRSDRTIFERIKFLHVSAANLDEFFMIRVGRLYSYIDYNRRWSNEMGWHIVPFREKLLKKAKDAFYRQHKHFLQEVSALCKADHLVFVQDIATLNRREQQQLKDYFQEDISPILTPVTFDDYHVFPVLTNRLLVFGVVTYSPAGKKDSKGISFIQIPQNLPRFYRLRRGSHVAFVPVEKIIREHMSVFFSNKTILSVTLFRVIRNGDFSFEENDDIEASFVEELQKKLKKRNKGRVVKLELEANHDQWLVDQLKHQWNIDKSNVFQVPPQSLMDLTGLQQIVQHSGDHNQLPVLPITYPTQHSDELFEILKQQDVLLHHPYNSINTVINFLEKAAEDPYVLAIKMTIYRLAPDSAVTAALLKAAERGKHVSVLIEIKARFDEEHNMQEAKKLEKAGCSVMYGMSGVKTHAKMMMIVRSKEGRTIRYVHLSSGNYNEETAQAYADISLMTTDEVYANDVSEFFRDITGHVAHTTYKNLITAPCNIRKQLTAMIRQEAQHAQQGLPCGIVIKVNALEDEITIEELYKASQAGVPIRLIVRGICCLIPQKPGLSTNITVRSIVGNFLEHARIFYFHNQGSARVYVGSADIMVRSFDQRIESLFIIKHPILKQQVINILAYDLRDNVNSYMMQEDGTYKRIRSSSEAPFNIHTAFFKVTLDEITQARLF